MVTFNGKEYESGSNGYWDLRNQLNDFVRASFCLLYEGAVRLNNNISADYYAPKRVQIGETRLHHCQGLKYAAGHKYNADAAPSEEQLRQTIADLTLLLKAASENILCPISVSIIAPPKSDRY